MKQCKRARFLALCLLSGSLVLNLTGCASTKDPADEFKGQTASTIFAGGEKALARGNYSTAVRHYEGLDALYPFSPYSEQAMLDSIYAYYQSDDPASAEASAARFIHVYPASPYVDYAYYMKGVSEMVQDRTWPERYISAIDLSTRDPGSARKAYITFATLIQQFPESRYAPDARARMVYLRNMFADYEIAVANYYYDRHAYVASANRASAVLEHYNGTPAEEKALGILLKSYRAMGKTAEANKALQVLQLNFPHSLLIKALDKP